MSLSVRQRRAARIRSAMEIVDRLIGHTGDVDGNWLSRRWDYRADETPGMWLTTPFSRNGRGDTFLAESNYRVISADLESVAAFGTDYRVDAWPGGTIHTLMVRSDDALALRAVQRWADALADYPIADESDLSELESEAITESWGWLSSDLYSDLPDALQDLYFDMGEDSIRDDFWALVSQSDYYPECNGDEVSWDMDKAREFLVTAMRNKRRAELGRPALTV